MRIRSLVYSGIAFCMGFYAGNYMHSHTALNYYARVGGDNAIISIINSKTKEQYILTKNFDLKYKSEIEKRIF